MPFIATINNGRHFKWFFPSNEPLPTVETKGTPCHQTGRRASELIFFLFFLSISFASQCPLFSATRTVIDDCKRFTLRFTQQQAM